MKKTLWLVGWLAAAALLLLAATTAQAQAPVQQTKRVRVVTKTLEPFVFKQGDTYSGFSIELWEELARRLNLQYDWVYVNTVNDQLAAVQNGSADVAIAGISMTPEREEIIDFSHPYFDAGLQIMVTDQSEPSILQLWRGVTAPALL